MTEEENKAIDYLKNLDIDFNTLYRINLRDLDNCKKVILNLIEKLKSRINKRDNEIIKLEESAEKEFLTKQEVKENYIPKSKIIVNKYKYENKCHVLRNEDSNYKWYEMGKNFGAVYALEELLEEKQEQ